MELVEVLEDQLLRCFDKVLRNGSLVLTGRAKDSIVLSSGENIEPGPLEEALISSPIIEQALLIGQDQKQLGALVGPKIEAVLIWAQQKV